MLSYSTFANLFGLGLEVENRVQGHETHNDAALCMRSLGRLEGGYPRHINVADLKAQTGDPLYDTTAEANEQVELAALKKMLAKAQEA